MDGYRTGLLLLCLVASCDTINLAEGIPAYIYVPDIELQTNASTRGSNSGKDHGCGSAWMGVPWRLYLCRH